MEVLVSEAYLLHIGQLIEGQGFTITVVPWYSSLIESRKHGKYEK